MCQALLEIMEPEINKIKENVEEEVSKKERKSAVAALRALGHGNMEVKNAIMEAYGISESEAEEYL